MKNKECSNISERLRDEALDMSLFEQAKSYAFDYMEHVLDQPVFPCQKSIDGLSMFKEPLPVDYGDPYEILERLHKNGSPGTVAQKVAAILVL